MAQNVTIAGASYTDVPAVNLPKTGGGTATFFDVSGVQEITENGNYDVTTKASVSVNVSGSMVVSSENANGTQNLSIIDDGSPISLPAKTITQNGVYSPIDEGAQGYGEVTVDVPAPVINLQDKTVTANGTVTADEGYDGLGTVTVNVQGMNVQGYLGYDTVNATAYTATNVKLTVAVTGTYTVSWMGYRNTTSGTNGSQLYINNVAYGTANTSFVNTYGQSVVLNNVRLTADQEIVVRARARSTSYFMGVGNLIIQQTA